MKLALIGFGRMGKAIEKIALNRQHNILLKSIFCPTYKDLKNVEVAIEFSHPEFAFANIKICLEENISVISGTTGWLFKMEEIKNICLRNSGTFLYASNFSIGVNLFIEISRKFAKLIKSYKKEYEVEIEEIHHVNKKDVPSGTAIKLAKFLIKEGIAKKWVLGKKKQYQLAISSKRFKNSPGIHVVKYQSVIENIIFKHTALKREGFALGAIIAAEWINYKKGIFSMKDVLEID
ncbi:dihydrodipicolinate reductase [Candidatus Uzinura diaspidicola str. ASNER]|uniref:4-hydroxy-tetrahydrodipicolinate reductase n=1 Tax=Candidatus Uzinura diaspidicola str. ASNER TaxID=1133592 RepID=L7VJM6_9FLAO|nr:dihydrodipicolinate reductase [Candidatus Uzinura diaspidicola str. ASNER]